MCSRSTQNFETFHVEFVHRTAKECTKNNVRAESLFCYLKLFFVTFSLAVAVVQIGNLSKHDGDG